ncbi:amino acid adenylation domain-containing protein [Chlorobaculum sp. 24CR]|uniref:non-ribosomal peptide synthetase n=1 Tax=Chlorobaculum sp. 24CR TaxID=2508878 RepID=UPI00100ABB92|nr:non-ribosomal peptide synthetase [Chlorobaculum sp. 24CR]RXK84775.1 amino acid adenylation domain-containing protein [Chlorobaculum sp. 24CR]
MKQQTTNIENRYGIETPLRYYDLFLCLHELFQKQAVLYPDHPAVIDADGALTYSELNERADHIADALIRKGIAPGSRIGLCATRSCRTVAGLLGILKAGCAWAPLDPAYPSERLGYIIDDSALSQILTQQHFSETLSFCPSSLLLLIDDDMVDSSATGPPAPVKTASGESAYVIYTSGTTGNPKGVCCHHKGVVNLLDDFQQRRMLGSDDRCSWWTTLNFDVSVYEIFSPLLAGATLLIVPDPVRIDSSALMEWLHLNHVTSTYLPPMMVADLAEWARQRPGESRLRRLLTGVEPIPSKVLLRLQRSLPELTIINGYGPTETTICATLFTPDPDTLLDETAPIGKAVQNMHISLLDENGNPVANGQTGEIHIGGVGVSSGYLNRPELNEALFVPDPAHRNEGCRMYRTGDLAFALPDGELVFAGRKDAQFKFMGYRIEPGEIEAVLKRHDGVRDAVVILREDEPGSKKLVAYCVAEPSGKLKPKALHAFAEGALPAYMIPGAFVFVSEIPMTPNGKTDRKALPPPARSDYVQEETAILAAPGSSLEQELSAVFAKILGMTAVGVDDNFFSFGGHSLMATSLCSQIRNRWNVDIPLAFVFENPTVKQIAKEIARKEKTLDLTDAITPSEAGRSIFPASLIQKGIWLMLQYQEEGTLFNIPVVVRFAGPLHAGHLAKAFDFLITRHDSLRTVFEIVDEELVQKVLPSMAVKMTVENLSDYPPDKQSAELEKIRIKEGRHQFTLETGPLLKLHLVIVGENEFQLFLTFHHLIIDGWGASLFFRELAVACEAFAGGTTPVLPDKKISYGDFSLWQRERLQNGLLREQIQYWIDRLKGASFIQNIPYDYSKPSTSAFSGARSWFTIPSERTASISDYCKQNRCTLFMYLMTAFQMLIRRYTGASDIVTGTTIANRNHPDTESIVGLIANTLAIRTDFTGDPAFPELLMQVRKASLEAFDHQDAPFELVVENIVRQHGRDHHPVLQNLFILQNTPEANFHAGDIAFTYEEIGNETAKIDLLLNAELRNGAIVCWIEYNTGLFHADTIERVVRDYLWIASHAIHENSAPVSSWPLPSIPETDLYAGNEKAPDVCCCHHLFERRAELTPTQIAVRSDNASLSFRELNEQANQLARLLMQRGVGANTPVGLCLQRNLRMVVGILGILKAGGCYVPLDSHYPEERIQYMARDSGIRLAITDELSAHALAFDENLDLLFLDRMPDTSAAPSSGSDNPVSRSGPEDTAYIMYTSGTSGEPKGIIVPHRGVTNLAVSAAETYGVTGRDTVLQFFSVSFDGSVEEIFMTLAAGATLLIRTFDTAITVPDFLAYIEEQTISVIDLPTAFWKELVHGVSVNAARIPDCLETVIIGGEQASAQDFRKWRQACQGKVRVINSYGPTECTVVSVCCDPEKIACSYDENRGLPIGKPVAGTQLFVVDEHLRRVPYGMPGELLIGGAGVAKGYINLPELTSERFIVNPFHEQMPHGRLYRTGDIVRSLPDGNLQFLGRKDKQVKIRGFRIEPGEIESRLNQHEQIRQSAVIDLKNNQEKTVLAAYFVSENNAPAASELRHYLAQKMPEYMVPSYFVPIEKIPLLPNGKIDRNALPPPDTAPERSRPCAAPENDQERALVEIWQEVLGVRPVGIDDNFFDLGGHSLLAVRLCSQIQKKMNRKVTLSGLFQSLTIKKLARTFSNEESITELSPAVCIHAVDSGRSLPPLFFIHILGTGLKFCRPIVRRLSPELPVYGLSIHLLEAYPSEGFSAEKLAKHYVREVRKIQPKGPYLLAGISFGGIIAFEMTRELTQAGETVALTALIDTNLPGAFRAPSGKEKIGSHREKFRAEGIAYLFGKFGEVLKYKWFDFVDECNLLYSRLQLRFYTLRAGGALPVHLKEFTANNQNEDALRRYQPSPCDSSVTLFKSKERFYDDNVFSGPQFGWGAIATGGVEIIDCPGDHFGMLAEPHVGTLAMKLMQSIEKSLKKKKPVPETAKEEIVIRSAETGDRLLFRDISLRSIRESPDAFVATLDQVQNEPLDYWEQLFDFIIDSPLDNMFLAFLGQRCLGFTAARIDANDPALSELRWMWVDRDFRGKGVGVRLLDKATEWTDSRGSRKMELWVSETQKAAIRLYASKGFVETGESGFLRPGSPLRARKMVYQTQGCR